MRSSIRCWVPKCKNRRYKFDVKCFSFPRNPTRLCKWLKVVGCRELTDLPYRFLTANRYVCQDHFSREEIQTRQHRVILASDAIPQFIDPTVAPLTDDDLEEFISRLPKEPVLESLPIPAIAASVEALSPYPDSEAASPSTAADHTYANSGSSDDEYSVIVVPDESPTEGSASPGSRLVLAVTGNLAVSSKSAAMRAVSKKPAAAQVVSKKPAAAQAVGSIPASCPAKKPAAVQAVGNKPAATQADQECRTLRRELRMMKRKAQTLQKEVEQLKALTKCQNLEVVLTVKCDECLTSICKQSVQL